MADLAQITLPSGDTYNFKDTVARSGISSGGTFVIAWAGTSDPSSDTAKAQIPAGVVVKYQSNPARTGTKVASADDLKKFFLVAAASQGDNQEVLDIYDEYVVIDNGENANPRYTWEKIGDTQIKLTAMVTDVTLNKQTTDFVTGYSNTSSANVIGANSSMQVTTYPSYTVTPATTYIKTDPSTATFLKKITPTSKKLKTTSVYGVKSGNNSTTTASKATAGTDQTTATGDGTWNNTTDKTWLKGCSVTGEVLTIGAATMATQTTKQFTFSDVTVPIRADSSTTVADGTLVDTSTTTNVGDTLVASVTSSGSGYTGDAVTSVGLATDTSSATGRVQVGSTGNSTVNRTTDAVIGWNSKDQKSALTGLGSPSTAKGLNNSTTITVTHPN